MNTLSKEECAALAAALANGGRFDELGPYQPVLDAGLAEWRVGNGKDVAWGDNHFALTPAGRIIAQQCKQREQDIGSQCALLSQIDELEQERDMLETDRNDWMATAEKYRVYHAKHQQPYWRPIAECGELKGERLFIILESPFSTIALCRDGIWPDGHDPTHIEYLGPNPVTVPAAPESEGT